MADAATITGHSLAPWRSVPSGKHPWDNIVDADDNPAIGRVYHNGPWKQNRALVLAAPLMASGLTRIENELVNYDECREPMAVLNRVAAEVRALRRALDAK